MASAVVVSASYDKYVRLWDPYTGRTTRSFQVVDSQVNCMCLAPDRSRLAVGLCGRIRWFDYSTFALCCVLEQTASNQPAFGNFTAMAYVPVAQDPLSASAYLVLSINEDSFIRLADARTSGQARLLREIATGGVALTCGALFPDNTLFVTGSQVGRIAVWHVPTIIEEAKSAAGGTTTAAAAIATKPLQEVVFRDDHAVVRSIAVSPMGNWVALAFNSGMVRALRFSRDVPKVHATPIASPAASLLNAAAPTPQGGALRSSAASESPILPGGGSTLDELDTAALQSTGDAADNASLLRPTVTSTSGSMFENSSTLLAGSAMSPTTAAAAASKPTGSWALSPLQALFQLEEFAAFRGHNKYILKCAISPNNLLLATSSADYTINVWLVPAAVSSSSGVPSSAAGASPPRVAAGGGVDASGDAPPSIAATMPVSPNKHTQAFLSQPALADGASASTNFPLLRTLQGHTRWVWDILFSPDSGNILSCSSDTHVRLWSNVLDRPKSEAFVGHTKPVNCIILDYERPRPKAMES